MIVGIPGESDPGEKRIAISPAAIEKIIKLGYEVRCQAGCGDRANFSDETLASAGATIVNQRENIWSESDVILKTVVPSQQEVSWMKPDACFIGFIWPARNTAILQQLAAQQVSAFAMDCVPRVTRAQKMDALSSMANIAGYRAIIEAANVFGSVFTGQITAAGKMPPAKVMVIGAGVAGLAAIGAAKGLGAIVCAFDTRLAAKEQVESMGAEFLELEFDESGEGEGGYAKQMSEEFIRKEMELFAEQAKDVDIIVTTALIPGKPAPRLITEQMVKSMREGSVIVDMAAEQGGNCELTEPDQCVRKHGVTLIGYSDLPSRLSTQASKLYANNLVNLLEELTDRSDDAKPESLLKIDLEDEVIRGSLVAHQGEVTWPPPKIEAASPSAPPQKESKQEAAQVATTVVASSIAAEPASSRSPGKPRRDTGDTVFSIVVLAVVAGMLLLLGGYVPEAFMARFTVFVLACFVGWQVVWNVTPALHSPLMSVTNAISGIILIGALLQIKAGAGQATLILASIAITIAMINISGGFLITQRMLSMFRK